MRCGRKIGGGVGSSVARAPFANRWLLSERQKFSLNFLGFVRQEFAKAPRPGHLRWLGMVSRVSKRKRLKFLDGPLHRLRCRASISHRHLDIGVTGEFAQGRKIDTGHRHTRQSAVTKVVKPKVRLEHRSVDRSHMCLSQAAERPHEDSRPA